MGATLEGKVALVTGGSRGIGAAIALRLAEEGADVALTYALRADRANAVVDQIKALGRRGLAIPADSGDVAALTGAVEAVVGEFGRLDILVSNAGVLVQGALDQTRLQDVERTLNVNVRGPFVAAQAAARHLTAGGRIITIGSSLIDRVTAPGKTLYATSKAALLGLTKGLARDLGERGITANLVSPGPIDTEMNPADGPSAAATKGFTALGRYGSAMDVAATVAYLAGESAGNITGAHIVVDGGITA